MPKISRERVLAIDCETTGLDVFHSARPFFVTVCSDEGEQDWWEWNVDPLTREVQMVQDDIDEIRQYVKNADKIVGQNLKFDVAMLREAGIVEEWPWEKTEDTLIAGHLLKSNQAHDLTTMALVYLGINIAPFEEELRKAVMKCRNVVNQAKLKQKRMREKGIKGDVSKYREWRIAKKGLPDMPSCKDKTWAYDMWILRAMAIDQKLPPKHPYWRLLRDYSNADSAVTIQLWKRMEELLKEQNLWEIYRERMKIPPVILDMERVGVSLSGKRLKEQVAKYSKESIEAGKKCLEIAESYGYDLVLPKSGNNGSLTKFCFEVMELDPAKKSQKTGMPSLDKATIDYYETTLKEGSRQQRFIQELSGKRKRDTAIQYMAGYEKFWMPLNDGKGFYVLHPSLNPTGTDTLRCSSSNPNEQNISAREGFNLRYAFGPAPGREWWSLDYENIELRIPGYKSGEQKMIELFERPDDPPYFGSYHLLNASAIFPKLFWPLAEIKGAFKSQHPGPYKRTKNTGFAMQYQCQKAKADATAGVRGAYEAIKGNTPRMTEYTNEIILFANKHGYVETLPDKSIGAERGYPIWCTRSSWGGVSPTIPFSYHVQSTAMWCTTKAMPRCADYLRRLTAEDTRGYYIVMQVHDEIVFDFPVGGKNNLPRVKKLKMLMEKSGQDIGIPLKVSINYHPANWSEPVEL